MESEWKMVPIGSLCEGIYDGPHATPVRTDSGPVFLGISSLVNGRLDLSRSDHLSEADFPRWTKRVTPRKHDLVFSYETRLGEAALIPDSLRCCLGRRMALMRIDSKKADPHFLLYAFLSPQFQDVIRSRTKQGSTVQRILLTEFADFPIAVPDVWEQQAIGRILSSLDDRIAVTEEANQSLEAIAQAIFKSWFVDFDPVRAKAEGREPEGMDAATASLFPGEFEESLLGQIPAGWNMGRLDDLLVLQRGFDLPNVARTLGPFPVIAASGPSGTHSEYRVKGPGVVTGRSGVLGNVYWVDDDFWPLNTSLWIKEYKRATPAYALQYLRTLDLSSFNAGSAVPTLNRNHIHGLPTVVPPTTIVQEFDEVATPLFESIRMNQKQAATLTDLRDTLLPRLISGKLRVPEAEALLTAV